MFYARSETSFKSRSGSGYSLIRVYCIMYINEYPIVYFNADPNHATEYTIHTVLFPCCVRTRFNENDVKMNKNPD